jgi:hypothetical protein
MQAEQKLEDIKPTTLQLSNILWDSLTIEATRSTISNTEHTTPVGTLQYPTQILIMSVFVATDSQDSRISILVSELKYQTRKVPKFKFGYVD